MTSLLDCEYVSFGPPGEKHDDAFDGVISEKSAVPPRQNFAVASVIRGEYGAVMAAAPEMARLLLEMAGSEGDGPCVRCAAFMAPHRDGCAIEAVLVKAGLRTTSPSSRDEG